MRPSEIISMVRSRTDTKTRDITINEVLIAIPTSRKLKVQITQIRTRFEAELAITGDRKKAKLAVDSLKKQLPGVTWSGRFSERRNDKLIKHSGRLCADLDLLGDRLPEIWQNLAQKSPHVFALFRSPTGDGIKAVFRVPADASKHLASFRAVEKHVLDLTGIQIDQACKDVSRLCFMSYDQVLYVNHTAVEIEPLPEKPKTDRRVKSNGQDGKPDKAQVRDMLAVIPKRPDYPDWIKVVAAVGDALPDDDAIELLNEWSAEETPGEYEEKLRHRLGEVHIGTLIHLAREHGWTGNKIAAAGVEPVELPPPPAPYVPPPLTLLPSLLQEYIHAAAESLNVDVAFILLPLLSSLGAAIGNSRSILLKRNFVQAPVIWAAIIGRSGSRKSPALEAGCFAVVENEQELMRQNKQAMEIYENALAEWESKSKRDRGVKPQTPLSLTCLMDDMTLEALADAMQENPHGVSVKKDELSHWFESFDQYHAGKGADVSRWLSLHTGVFFGLDRRTDKRRYRIHQPRVCVTGGIQPKVLRRVLTEDFFERGLPARFLFAHPPMRQDKWREAEVSGDIRAGVLELFGKLWVLQPSLDDHGQQCPKLLPLDSDAHDEFVRYYNECGTSAVQSDEHEEAAWHKLSGYAARLALVSQLVRDPDAETVTGETMRAACNLARWFGAEAVRIYASLAETAEQRETRKLVEFIASRGGSVTVREVYTYYRPLRNSREQAEWAVNQLVKRGYGKWVEIKPEAGSKGGRPTLKFQLLQVSASAKPTRLTRENHEVVQTQTAEASCKTHVSPASCDDQDKQAESVIGDELGVSRL